MLTEPDGRLPSLYTYSAQSFDITDVMGVFDRDDKGKICIVKHENKNEIVLMDKSGHLVN